MTPEKKVLLFKIGIGLVITSLLIGYTYVWIKYVDIQAYRHASLVHTNYLRARHGSPPLTLNLDLCEIAQMCAVYYASIQKIDHSCQFNSLGKNFYFTKEGTGENLWITNNGWTDMAAAVGGARRFYQEIEDYNFSDVKSNHEKFLKVGHITQELWIGSKELGVGIASATSSTPAYIVYQYYPAGNMWTEDMEYVEKNVKPPLPGIPAIEIYGFWGWLPENVTKNVEAEENNFLQTRREFKELAKEMYG